MSTRKKTKIFDQASLPLRLRSLQVMIASLLLLAVSTVQAVPMTPPGFLDDVGDSYFTPGDITVGVELLDAIDPASEFGFFFRSDPSTLITMFDGSDVGPGQVVGINFVAGEILDIDTPSDPLDEFVPLNDEIGFYLTIAGAVTLFSDPLLNTHLGGADLFFAFQNTSNPLQWALFFEGDLGANGTLEPIGFDLVNPLVASVVPLPPTVFLMGSLIPLLMLMSRRRRLAR